MDFVHKSSRDFGPVLAGLHKALVDAVEAALSPHKGTDLVADYSDYHETAYIGWHPCAHDDLADKVAAIKWIAPPEAAVTTREGYWLVCSEQHEFGAGISELEISDLSELLSAIESGSFIPEDKDVHTKPF